MAIHFLGLWSLTPIPQADKWDLSFFPNENQQHITLKSDYKINCRLKNYGKDLQTAINLGLKFGEILGGVNKLGRLPSLPPSVAGSQMVQYPPKTKVPDSKIPNLYLRFRPYNIPENKIIIK